MTDNVVDFKAPRKHLPAVEMFAMYVNLDNEGDYEVLVEVDDQFTEAEIFAAMMAATIEYGVGNGILEDEEADS